MEKMLKTTAKDRVTKTAEHVNGGIDHSKEGVLDLQAFGIWLENIVQTEMMGGKQNRKQQNRKTEKQHIYCKNIRTADQAEPNSRKADNRGDSEVVERHPEQPRFKILQYHVWVSVISIVEHILVTVKKHSAAGLVGNGHKIHDKDKCREYGSEILTNLLGAFRVKPKEYGGRDEQDDSQ